MRTPHQTSGVQTWEIGDDLAQRKRTVVDTCRQAGKDDSIIAVVLAVLMGETERGSADARDTSKDFSPLARNFSAYNLNGDFLQSVGITGDAAERLNQDANLACATKAVLAGIDKYGLDRMLSYHRGGSTARDDLTSYGAAEYRAAMYSIRDFILSNKDIFRDGRRAGLFIQHV